MITPPGHFGPTCQRQRRGAYDQHNHELGGLSSITPKRQVGGERGMKQSMSHWERRGSFLEAEEDEPRGDGLGTRHLAAAHEEARRGSRVVRRGHGRRWGGRVPGSGRRSAGERTSGGRRHPLQTQLRWAGGRVGRRSCGHRGGSTGESGRCRLASAWRWQRWRRSG
jgi:hypothetical protein